MSLLDRLLRIDPPPEPTVAPGLYHYRRGAAGESSRIHLRVDRDGLGTLMVNAERVIQLNSTATLMASMLLAGNDESGIVRSMGRKFRAQNHELQRDVAALHAQLDELIRPDGACPLHELGLDVAMPFSAHPSAPYRMDLALTYRCNNDCAHCYNARERSFPELSTGEWKRILDRLWELGIPHIVFTGGESTLRQDLPELIAHAEGLGQITGLNTNGRRLADPMYVQELVAAGLDHVQITVESADAGTHNAMVGCGSAFTQTVRGVQNALSSRLFVMTNTTMLTSNVHTLGATLDFLADLGVPTVGLNALIYSGRGVTVGTGLREAELQPLLDLAIRKTENRGQRLIWYTPTQYCEFDPTQHNLGVKACTAALYSMCIEPNGDVLPCQSYYYSLGSILEQPWSQIWNHELAIQLRERRDLPHKCSGCSLVAACGGGCPLVVAHDAAAGVGLPVLSQEQAQIR